MAENENELFCHHGTVLGLSPLSVVYEGNYQGRIVAVKKISTNNLRDREIETVRFLNHENVVKILVQGNSSEEETVYRSLVLELCVGTLEDVFLGPCDHLPMSEIPDHFQGLLHMARGLEHIHSKGMLHGSVKPSNILISKTVHSGVVLKVSQDSVSTLTQKLSFNAVLSLQTLKYWPPEALKLLDGNETLKRPTASGDIFALGCIFHGYVSDGAHPFGRGVHVLFNIMGSINFLANITNHPAVEIIRKMIQPDSSSRPSMAKVLATVAELSLKPRLPTRSPENCKLPGSSESEEHARYINGFRVNNCKDFYSNRKCTNNFCFDYHSPNQRRRRCFIKKDGSFNYEGNDMCLDYDKETGMCPRRDDCPKLHDNVGVTERRFHLSNYKTELCKIPNCKHPHCSFAHGPSDLRTPVYGKQSKQVKTVTKKTIEVLDNNNNFMWNDANNVINNYKTRKCVNTYENCPQRKSCHFYHNSRDRRRNLKKFAYWPQPCPNVYDSNKSEWTSVNCRQGDKCRYCHNNREYQYHVLTYKTVLCLNLKNGGVCPQGLMCAFAHSQSERRKTKQFQVGEMNHQELMAYLQLF